LKTIKQKYKTTPNYLFDFQFKLKFTPFINTPSSSSYWQQNKDTYVHRSQNPERFFISFSWVPIRERVFGDSRVFDGGGKE
jgi:hypothetical protein